MKKHLNRVSALILAVFWLLSVGTASGQGFGSTANSKIPQVISEGEAAKKYPPPNGKSYPLATSVPTDTGGFYQSPYRNEIYDCRRKSCPQCGRGVLVLDVTANKVFRIP
jgi:hypothetical protein